jgi:hypothetical protein
MNRLTAHGAIASWLIGRPAIAHPTISEVTLSMRLVRDRVMHGLCGMAPASGQRPVFVFSIGSRYWADRHTGLGQ